MALSDKDVRHPLMRPDPKSKSAAELGSLNLGDVEVPPEVLLQQELVPDI